MKDLEKKLNSNVVCKNNFRYVHEAKTSVKSVYRETEAFRVIIIVHLCSVYVFTDNTDEYTKGGQGEAHLGVCYLHIVWF